MVLFSAVPHGPIVIFILTRSGYLDRCRVCFSFRASAICGCGCKTIKCPSLRCPFYSSARKCNCFLIRGLFSMTDKGRRRLIGCAVIGISIPWKAAKAFSCRRTKNDRPSFPFLNRELLSSTVFASKQQFRTWTSAAKSVCGDKRPCFSQVRPCPRTTVRF